MSQIKIAHTGISYISTKTAFPLFRFSKAPTTRPALKNAPCNRASSVSPAVYGITQKISCSFS